MLFNSYLLVLNNILHSILLVLESCMLDLDGSETTFDIIQLLSILAANVEISLFM